MEKWEGISVGELTRTALKEIRDAIFETLHSFNKPKSEIPDDIKYGMTEKPPKRARGKKGKFLADDKSTAYTNEAWVGGKAPKKKAKRKTKGKK